MLLSLLARRRLLCCGGEEVGGGGRRRSGTGLLRNYTKTLFGRFFATKSESVLITTPIFYVNARPHIGHLYSALIGDVIARWSRMRGKETLFVTGTDEHGSKVEAAAKKEGMEVERFCDKVSSEFRRLFDRADISYDDFIRTTEDRHKRVVEEVWGILSERGFISLGSYEGWYSVSDETFLSNSQIIDQDVYVRQHGEKDKRWVKSQSGKVSLESGQPVDWVAEETYHFHLSQFAQKLSEWLTTGS